MFGTFLTLFVLLTLYAVFGNVFVYVYLLRHGVSVRFGFAGMPGYLASLCSKNVATVGPAVVWVARGTDVAFLACMVLAVGLFARQ